MTSSGWTRQHRCEYRQTTVQEPWGATVTATTLGYGELVLSERWRLLITFEAMGGLMLVGVSAAYVTLSVHRDADSDSGLGRCGVEAATLIARCRSHD